MRYSILDSQKKNPIGNDIKTEYRRYRFCGMILFLMDVVLGVMVILSVYFDATFDYPGFLIYAMAVYSFYAVCYAIPSLISYRKHGSPLLSATKAVTLTGVLVSMLSLEIAMTARFGAGAHTFRRVMTGATGGAVCAIVLGMAFYMIVRATREIGKAKPDEKFSNLT